MIRFVFSILAVTLCIFAPAMAQERVTVGTTRDLANAALFVAATQGYFKAEGLDIEMTAYASDKDVAVALAAGATDLGLAAFTATAFDLAGQNKIKAVAAQAREKEDYDGTEVVASVAAYERGLRKPADLAKMSVATAPFGTTLHYQLGLLARVNGFDFDGLTLKPQGSLRAVARAVAEGAVDAAILPGPEARLLLTTNQAKLVAWYSQVAEPQLGALFASSAAIAGKRGAIEKFLRAYRRGASDYAAAFLRHDKYGKPILKAPAHDLAAKIARYVFPGRPVAEAVPLVESGIYYIDPQARLDAADVRRQVEWYQGQGLVDKAIDPRDVLDSSFR